MQGVDPRSLGDISLDLRRRILGSRGMIPSSLSSGLDALVNDALRLGRGAVSLVILSKHKELIRRLLSEEGGEIAQFTLAFLIGGFSQMRWDKAGIWPGDPSMSFCEGLVKFLCEMLENREVNPAQPAVTLLVKLVMLGFCEVNGALANRVVCVLFVGYVQLVEGRRNTQLADYIDVCLKRIVGFVVQAAHLNVNSITQSGVNNLTNTLPPATPVTKPTGLSPSSPSLAPASVTLARLAVERLLDFLPLEGVRPSPLTPEELFSTSPSSVPANRSLFSTLFPSRPSPSPTPSALVTWTNLQGHKSGRFGWCFICHKGASYYSASARLPLCSISCAAELDFLAAATPQPPLRPQLADAAMLFKYLCKVAFHFGPPVDPPRIYVLTLVLEVLRQAEYPFFALNANFVRVGENLLPRLVEALAAEGSAAPTVFRHSLLIFNELLKRYKKSFKAQFGIVIGSFLLPLLRSTGFDEQKRAVEEAALDWCRDSHLLAIFYLNFDLDPYAFPLLGDILSALIDRAGSIKTASPLAALKVISAFLESCGVGLGRWKRVEAGEAKASEGRVIGLVEAEKKISTFISAFNEKPIRAVESLKISNANDEEKLARLLFNCRKVSPAKLMEFFSEDSPLSARVFNQYLRYESFEGYRVDWALRVLVSRIVLSGEGQRIDRVLEIFSRRLAADNKLPEDPVFMLTHLVLMLHTNLHNPQVNPKMPLEEFARIAKSVPGIDRLLTEADVREVFAAVGRVPLGEGDIFSSMQKWLPAVLAQRAKAQVERGLVSPEPRGVAAKDEWPTLQSAFRAHSKTIIDFLLSALMDRQDSIRSMVIEALSTWTRLAVAAECFELQAAKLLSALGSDQGAPKVVSSALNPSSLRRLGDSGLKTVLILAGSEAAETLEVVIASRPPAEELLTFLAKAAAFAAEQIRSDGGGSFALAEAFARALRTPLQSAEEYLTEEILVPLRGYIAMFLSLSGDMEGSEAAQFIESALDSLTSVSRALAVKLGPRAAITPFSALLSTPRKAAPALLGGLSTLCSSLDSAGIGVFRLAQAELLEAAAPLAGDPRCAAQVLSLTATSIERGPPLLDPAVVERVTLIASEAARNPRRDPPRLFATVGRLVLAVAGKTTGAESLNLLLTLASFRLLGSGDFANFAAAVPPLIEALRGLCALPRLTDALREQIFRTIIAPALDDLVFAGSIPDFSTKLEKFKELASGLAEVSFLLGPARFPHRVAEKCLAALPPPPAPDHNFELLVFTVCELLRFAEPPVSGNARGPLNPRTKRRSLDDTPPPHKSPTPNVGFWTEALRFLSQLADLSLAACPDLRNPSTPQPQQSLTSSLPPRSPAELLRGLPLTPTSALTPLLQLLDSFARAEYISRGLYNSPSLSLARLFLKTLEKAPSLLIARHAEDLRASLGRLCERLKVVGRRLRPTPPEGPPLHAFLTNRALSFVFKFLFLQLEAVGGSFSVQPVPLNLNLAYFAEKPRRTAAKLRALSTLPTLTTPQFADFLKLRLELIAQAAFIHRALIRVLENIEPLNIPTLQSLNPSATQPVNPSTPQPPNPINQSPYKILLIAVRLASPVPSCPCPVCSLCQLAPPPDNVADRAEALLLRMIQK